MIYQHGNFGLDALYSYGYGTAYGQAEREAHHPLGDKRMDYSGKTEQKNQTLNHNCRIGLDYAFSQESRLNVAYTGKWTSNDVTNTSTGLETSVQKSETHTYLHNVDASYTSPFGLQLSSTTAIRFSQRHDIRLVLNPFFQSKAIQGVYDIDPMFRLNTSLRWTSDNKKWSVIVAGNNITNRRLITHSRLANQDYTLRMWMQYPNVSLTAIYRIGGFKEKKTKAIDTSRMGY